MIASMQIRAFTLGKTNSLTVNYEDLNIWGHPEGVLGRTEAANTRKVRGCRLAAGRHNKIEHSLDFNICGTDGKITLNHDSSEGIPFFSFVLFFLLFLFFITYSTSMQKRLKNVATVHICCITVNESLGIFICITLCHCNYKFHNTETGISEC